MVQTLCTQERQNVLHGITSVPNARSEAIMNGPATHFQTMANGAINPSKAGGVENVRTSRTQNLSWVP